MLCKLSFPKLFAFFLATSYSSPVVFAFKGARQLTLRSNKNKSGDTKTAFWLRPDGHPNRKTLSSTLHSTVTSLNNFGHNKEHHDRALQRRRCLDAMTTLFDENPALVEAGDNLTNALKPFYKQCTQNPCVIDEDEVVDEAIIGAHRNACLAANGTLYEYDLYLTCTNSTGGYYSDWQLNFDFCFPSSFYCPPSDIDARMKILLSRQGVDVEADFADWDYTCDESEVEFVGSENKPQSVCNDNTKALFDANPSLAAARDKLDKNFGDVYTNCTDIDVDCVTDEDELDGAQEYVDECLAAGGRIWEFNFYIGCINRETNATKNETILGYDACAAMDDCPWTVTEPLFRQELRVFQEDLSGFLGSDWVCPYTRLERSSVIPFPGQPTTRSPTPPRSPNNTPTSSSSLVTLAASSFLMMVAATVMVVL